MIYEKSHSIRYGLKKRDTKGIDYWAVGGRKLSSMVLRKGISLPILTGRTGHLTGKFWTCGGLEAIQQENSEIAELGLIKPLSFGNKLERLLPGIILRNKIGWRSKRHETGIILRHRIGWRSQCHETEAQSEAKAQGKSFEIRGYKPIPTISKIPEQNSLISTKAWTSTCTVITLNKS